MLKGRVLFLVASSFQIDRARDIVYNFENERKVIIVVKNDQSVHQLEDTIRELKDYGCTVIYSFRNYYFLYYYLISFIVGFFKRIYIGDFKSAYFNLAIRRVRDKKNKICYFDDGASSLYLLSLIKNGLRLPVLNDIDNSRRLKLMLLYILGVKYKDISMDFYRFYTIFHHDEGGIKAIPLNVGAGNLNFVNHSSIYLGGKYVDIGIIEMEEYVKSVKLAFELSNGDMYYVCHRSEPEYIRKELVRFIPNIKILENKEPIEKYLIKECWSPNCVYSLYSTAIFTLYNIFDTKCFYYMVDINKVCSQHKNAVASVYQCLEENKKIKRYYP